MFPELTYAIFVPSGDHAGSVPVTVPSAAGVQVMTVQVSIAPPSEKASFVPSGDHEGSVPPVTRGVPELLARKRFPLRTKAMSPFAPLLVAPSAPPPSGRRTRRSPPTTAQIESAAGALLGVFVA